MQKVPAKVPNPPVESGRAQGCFGVVLDPLSLWASCRDRRGHGARRAIPSAALRSLGVVCTVPTVGRLFQLAPLTAPKWALTLLVAVGAAFWEEPLKAWRTRPAGRAA